MESPEEASSDGHQSNEDVGTPPSNDVMRTETSAAPVVTDPQYNGDVSTNVFDGNSSDGFSHVQVSENQFVNGRCNQARQPDSDQDTAVCVTSNDASDKDSTQLQNNPSVLNGPDVAELDVPSVCSQRVTDIYEVHVLEEENEVKSNDGPLEERVSYIPNDSSSTIVNMSSTVDTSPIHVVHSDTASIVPSVGGVALHEDLTDNVHSGQLQEYHLTQAIETAIQGGNGVSTEQTTEGDESGGKEHFQKIVQEFLDGINMQMATADEEEPENTESLAKFVQENIASKNIRTIKYTLKNLMEADRKAVVDYDIDGKTALFVACEQGTSAIVKYFVTECNADTNKDGKYDCGEKNMMVAPLWLATIEEQPEVVQVLASNGADVNVLCETGSTAVHAACYMNNIELVNILCENGSDVNIPDTLGSTCLKDSVDNLEMCKILIAKGADVNFRKNNQYSILHHAVKAHNLETVQLLVQNGADIMASDFEGNNCLRYAVLVYSPDIAEFLLDSVNADAPLSADIYDLMGAMAIGKGEYKDGYVYWIRSMYIRTELHGGPTSLQTIPEIFGEDVEIPHSISDVIALTKNCDDMDTLALSIITHQLGPTHGDTIQRILLQSSSLMRNDDLVQAFDMTRYAYSLLLSKHEVLHRLQEFALSQLFEICSKFQIETLRGITIPRFKEMLEVFRDMVDFIENAHLLKTTNTEYFIQHASIFDKVLNHIFDMIYLLKVNTKLSEEKHFFKAQMRRLVSLHPCDIQGVTLLHKSLTRNPKVVFHFMEPNPREGRHEDLCVTRELLYSGANVNIQDLKRDTPLHSHLKWIEKYNFFSQRVVELFLENGLHVDLVDTDRTSLFAMLQARGMTLCPVKHHTLQCLAVKVIHDNNIQFRTLLPVPLQNFVDMHR